VAPCHVIADASLIDSGAQPFTEGCKMAHSKHLFVSNMDDQIERESRARAHSQSTEPEPEQNCAVGESECEDYNTPGDGKSIAKINHQSASNLDEPDHVSNIDERDNGVSTVASESEDSNCGDFSTDIGVLSDFGGLSDIGLHSSFRDVGGLSGASSPHGLSPCSPAMFQHTATRPIDSMMGPLDRMLEAEKSDRGMLRASPPSAARELTADQSELRATLELDGFLLDGPSNSTDLTPKQDSSSQFRDSATKYSPKNDCPSHREDWFKRHELLDPSSSFAHQLLQNGHAMCYNSARWVPMGTVAVLIPVAAVVSPPVHALVQSWPAMPVAQSSSASSTPPPPPLEQVFSPVSGGHSIYWHVPARELSSDGSRFLSPPFELSFGSNLPNVSFKVLLNVARARSFKKSKGCGYFQLKCESSLAASTNARVTFQVSVDGQTARGPVEHDFASKATCGLPQGQEVWNLSHAVNPKTKTCRVCLEILPPPKVATDEHT